MDRGQGQSTKTIDKDNRQRQSTKTIDKGNRQGQSTKTIDRENRQRQSTGTIDRDNRQRQSTGTIDRDNRQGISEETCHGLTRAAIQSVGRSLFREVKIFAEGKRGPAQGAAIECSYCYGRGATTGCAGCQNSENIK